MNKAVCKAGAGILSFIIPFFILCAFGSVMLGAAFLFNSVPIITMIAALLFLIGVIVWWGFITKSLYPELRDECESYWSKR